MKVHIPGHRYLLQTLDYIAPFPGYDAAPQILQFVCRMGAQFPGNTIKFPGTTSQDVLRCLIDRAVYVNNQIPCWQTRLSILLMKLVIWLYEQRAAKRHNRKAPRFREACQGEMCRLCGHVGCKCRKLS